VREGVEGGCRCEGEVDALLEFDFHGFFGGLVSCEGLEEVRHGVDDV